MKREERLHQLFQSMRAGKFSRNQHFSAYLEDDVLNARARARRFERLWRMLDHAIGERWQFQLLTQGPDQWTLLCRSTMLEGSWRARLYTFELRELSRHPDAHRLIPELSISLDALTEDRALKGCSP